MSQTTCVPQKKFMFQITWAWLNDRTYILGWNGPFDMTAKRQNPRKQWENARNYGGRGGHSQGKQDVLTYFWWHRWEANLYWGPLSSWQREKQRRLIWSALIISRAADFLWALVPTVQHGSAIRAEAANRGRNIKSFQAALTQWELAELRY